MVQPLARSLAVLVLAAGLASSAAPSPSSRALEAAAEGAAARVATQVAGDVQRADGTPVSGAVVVTSHGGEVVTGADGRFEIEVAVPPGARVLHVTAVASADGTSLSGSAAVRAAAAGRRTDAGTVVVAAGTACEPSWLPTFGALAGVDDEVLALVAFDDGSGPALYAGGRFATAGGVAASRVARWDGSAWTPLGGGVQDGDVLALATFDDGTGPALYAGGSFTSAGGAAANRIARWDGETWSPLGSGMDDTVSALAVFDDGSGPALCAGGDFTSAGAVAASHVASWDGSQWSPLAAGTSATLWTLEVFDDGSGPALYAGGDFGIQQWDGSGWSAVGGGVDLVVYALAVFDDGAGAKLCAGGTFMMAGGSPASRVAAWDGSQWSALGSGVNDTVLALAAHDDGSGPALFAGGRFLAAGGMPADRVARWDGSGWSGLDAGMSGTFDGHFVPDVRALCVADLGIGPELYAGGSFTSAGGEAASGVARWDGSAWSPFPGSGMNDDVRALEVFDDGTGPALYAGGDFTSAGGADVRFLARWDGTTWSPLGSGVDEAVRSLAVFDDGSGPALYAGGDFTTAGSAEANRIARWDGSAWSPLGDGIDPFFVGLGPEVRALAVFDDGSGPALYAGGYFWEIDDFVANGVARWDGSTWSDLDGGVNDLVNSLAVFDDGTGPALYAGGDFSNVGGVSAGNVARWNGTAWSAIGGVDGTVEALSVFDDGAGPALFVGGDFFHAGGVLARRVARWDGSVWSPLGSGPGAAVHALAAFDDGSGPALYAGGAFTTAGGAAASRIARWDGSAWSPLGGGTSGPVRALLAFDEGDGGGPALHAGGDFGAALDSGDAFLARWGCPPSITPVPGCFENPATLVAPTGPATVGQTLLLQVQAGAIESGLAILFLGGAGTDGEGCGTLLLGFGELLLALAPAPIAIAEAPVAGGTADLPIAVPADPSLVGVTVAFQAAGLGAPPGPPVEVSTGLAVRFVE